MKITFRIPKLINKNSIRTPAIFVARTAFTETQQDSKHFSNLLA